MPRRGGGPRARGEDRRAIAALEAPLAERRTWRFDDARRAERHAVLAALDAAARRVAGLVPSVARRRADAATLAERSLAAHAAAWSAVIAEIADPARSPAYRGLGLAPQLGLVPLGRDPESGLMEFAHVATGAVPARAAGTGRLALAPESAVVLVLVPGGRVRIGAAAPGPGRPAGTAGTDPGASIIEGPEHAVDLAPYFISKYEMTQAQWERLAGANPSSFRPPDRAGGRDVLPLDPVENLSWREARQVLARVGLDLPTEAQWEAACRAGTASVFATGNAIPSLQGAANIADEGASRYYPRSWMAEPGLSDGFAVHAPVGSFQPNAFGLHDVHGNVAELCRDGFAGYGEPVAGPDALRASPPGAPRLHRGGSYARPASDARAAARSTVGQDDRLADVGIRPARAVDP